MAMSPHPALLPAALAGALALAGCSSPPPSAAPAVTAPSSTAPPSTVASATASRSGSAAVVPAGSSASPDYHYDIHVLFPITGSTGTTAEFDRLTELEYRIMDAANESGSEFDGNDIGQGVQTDYVVTNDPDQAVAALIRHLPPSDLPPGTTLEVYPWPYTDQPPPLKTVRLS